LPPENFSSIGRAVHEIWSHQDRLGQNGHF
jgi:hypothetical protein